MECFKINVKDRKERVLGLQLKVSTHYSISFMLKQTYISNKYNTTSSILSNTISRKKTIKVDANATCDRSKMAQYNS